MPIQIKPQVQGNTYAFNESRLAKIVKANTLAEAEKMGFRDRMIDRFFRNNEKRDAIRSLYASITDPAPHEAKPADLVTRFGRLRDLAAATDRLQFKTQVQNPTEAGGEWHFDLMVGDTAIYASPADMRDTPESSHEEFTQALKLDQAKMAVRLVADKVSEQRAGMLDGRTPESYAQGTVDHVSDDREIRGQLKAELGNPLFCTSNFRGITAGEDPNTFKATFEAPGGERRELVLNNRPATLGEFRGERLQKALSQGAYETLGQLFSADFNGPQDRIIRGLANATTTFTLNEINDATEGKHSAASLKQDLLALRQTHPQEAFALFNELRNTPLGDTHLLEVLYGPELLPEVSTRMDDLLTHLDQPRPDALDALQSAAQLSWSVLFLVGDDPEGAKGIAMTQPLFAARAAQMSNEALQQAFQAQVDQPILIRTYGAVTATQFKLEDTLGRVAERGDHDAAIARSRPFLHAGDLLEARFNSLRDELKTRGLLDPLWADPKKAHEDKFFELIPTPVEVDRFLDLHVGLGLDPREAVAQAREPAAAEALPGYALRV